MILHKTISKHSANFEQSMLNLVFFHNLLALVANLTFAARDLAQVCPCAGYDRTYKTQLEHSGHTKNGTCHTGMENVCPANL